MADLVPKGAPPMYATPEEMQIAIDRYFDSCWEEDWRPVTDSKTGATKWIQQFDKNGNAIMKLKQCPTITGLALALGFNSRQALLNYQAKNAFYDTVKKAKALVEQYVEQGLLSGSVSTIGAIFNLKNNFGWVDKLEISMNNEPDRLMPTDIQKQIEERKNSSQPEDTGQP